jgi:tRNA-specific 2-thiouridylase
VAAAASWGRPSDTLFSMGTPIPATRTSALADHLSAPRGLGALADAPHAGAAGGAACGDLIRVSVRVEGDRVAAAGFDARGCAAAGAAGSAAVELAAGAPLLDVASVTPADVAAELGGLDRGRMHAAVLATDALHRALGAAARDGAATLRPSAGRTLVAMSGGVDSAAAARIALDRGDEVVAVTLELWSDPATDGERSCCSPQAVTGARALAHSMGVPHLTLDVRDAFRAGVVEDFLDEHAAGRTPNPCVRCNGIVRFDAMLALAGRLGAARLATGHYARIEDDDGRGPLVRAAADPAKDQSYVLARLEPAELERIWLPLADLTKPEVRTLARAAGLAVADKRESQDLCFLAGVGKRGFLRRHGRARLETRPGELVDEDGRAVGRHDGQHEFTVGQRRGLGVAAPVPLYVLDKDARTNRVTVGPRERLAATRVEVAPAVLHRDGAAVSAVRLRYRSAPLPCAVEDVPAAGGHERLVLALDEPADSVAPGQTACLLDGDRVVGWGTIAAALPRAA